jgi:hypothetical protein
MFSAVGMVELNEAGTNSGANGHFLRRFQALQFYPVGMDMGKLVMYLLRKPALGAATKDLREPHGHFGGNATLFVDEF